MKKILFTLIVLIALQLTASAQNTFPANGAAGIGTTTPNASSLLDISSTTKGILIPRMTKSQRDAIVAPAEGLLIYQTTNSPGVYYYDGSSWSSVAPKGANKSLGNLSDTKIDVDLLPATDNTVSIGSQTKSWKDANFSGNANFDGKGYFLGGLNIGSFGNQTATVEISPASAAALRINPYTSGLFSSTGEFQMMEAAANGFNYVGFKAPSNITANKIWTLPAADGTNGQVLSTNGAGVLSWVTGTGGGAETDPQVGNNTTGYVPVWDGTALSKGTIYDNGTKIGIGTPYPNGYLHLNGDGDADVPHLQIKETDADGYARIYMSSFTGEVGDNRKWKILARTSLTDNNNNFLIQQVSKVNGVEFGSNRLSIIANGDMGIGTDAPLARLHIVPGSTDKFRVGSETGTPAFIVDALGKVGINVLDPNSTFHVNGLAGEDAMRIQVNGATKLYVNNNGGVSVGSPVAPPSNGLFVSGNAGFGISSPQTVVHISGTDEVLRLDGTNPYMRFFNSGAEKGYVQQTGNDFKLGTVGTNSSGKVQITAGSATAMTIKSSGYVGIGTTSPSTLLHIKGTGSMLRLEGTDGALSFFAGTTEKGFIQRQGDNIVVGSSSGMVTIGNNVAGTVMYVTTAGTVGIGTSDTKGYKLGVDGNIVCEELKVKLSQNWPDYVFADDYKLPSLKDVEAAIAAGKHLPGIPSAKEMHEEGINVGEMQKLMMQKIEELTLYVIDLQKQNNALVEKVSALENQ